MEGCVKKSIGCKTTAKLLMWINPLWRPLGKNPRESKGSFQPFRMKRLFLLEPAMGLCAFSFFLSYPLMQQFVYRRLWVQVTNTTYPISDTSRCATNSSSNNHSNYTKEVQRQASLFSLYTDVLSTVPSLVATIMLVAYSDQVGRRMAIITSVIGMLINNLAYLTVSYFELNIYLLIGCSILSSMFGGLGTFLGTCFAYIADLCNNRRQKTLRMAGVDVMIGPLALVAAISAGYFLRTAGFNWPFLTSSLILGLVLIYTVFIVEETVKEAPTDSIILDMSPQHSAIKQMMCGVYWMLAGTSHGGKIGLALLLVIFASFSFAYFGGTTMITLYELNEPLCWTEILIGYGSALFTTVFLTSFVGVLALTCCGVPQLFIVLLGILSMVLSMILAAFAKTTSLMFIAIASMFLCKMPFPVLRSMMSEVVSTSEQGALFAFIYFLEILTGSVSVGIFNSIYAATVAWCPGFVFLLSAGLCAIPLFIIGVVGVMGIDVTKGVPGTEPFTLEEESHDEKSPLYS